MQNKVDRRAFLLPDGGGAGLSSNLGASAVTETLQTRPEAQAKVRLNLDLSQEIAEFLDTLAQENSTTKTDVMRRAIALLKIAHDEKKRNRSMGFVTSSKDECLETKIVGIL